MAWRNEHGRNLRAGQLALALSLLMVGVVGSPSAAATVRCSHIAEPGEPCLGPIETAYAYDGYSEGDTSLIKASFGSNHEIGKDANKDPIMQRTVSWHSAPGVKIVAVFVITRTWSPKLHFHYRQVPSGPHSGHVTLTARYTDGVPLPPLLAIQGERIGREPIRPPSKASHCIFQGVPCLGDLETYYAFNGRTAGATKSLIASLGPEEPAGTNAEGDPLVTRQLHWHTAGNVKLVAAYEVIAFDEHHVQIHRLPTGTHSGEATFTIPTNPTNHRPVGQIPILLLEGDR